MVVGQADGGSAPSQRPIARLPVASTRLPAHPTSSRAAREFVTTNLHLWGYEGVVDDAVLLVSELVTNAVIHARTPVDLVVRRVGSALRIEVFDDGHGVPEPRYADLDDSAGRGLGLVQALATRWGVDDKAGGKTVWFELPAG